MDVAGRRTCAVWLVAAVVGVGAAAVLSPVASAQAYPSLSYIVRIEPGRPAIQVALTLEDAGSSFVLRLRDQSASAENGLHNLTASSGGSPVAVTDAGDARWSVSGAGPTFRIDYEVDRQILYQGGNELAVYASDSAAYLMGAYVFLYPEVADATSIDLQFIVPEGWQVVTPFLDDGGNNFHPQRVTRSLIVDFVTRQQIYMGRMRFYAEAAANGTTVRFGVPEADRSSDTAQYLNTQGRVQAYADRTLAQLRGLADVYGENPFRVFTMYTNFMPSPSGPRYGGTRFFGNGYQHYPPTRADYTAGHMSLAFIDGDSAPVAAAAPIQKGVGEFYYGKEVAWRTTRDPVYLARFYHVYLAYERMWDAPGLEDRSDFEDQIKPSLVALLLDREIRSASGNTSSLDTAMRHLYASHKNTGRTAGWSDLKTSIQVATGYDATDLFARYVDGHAKIPVAPYIDPYRPHFLNYAAPLAQGQGWLDFGGTLSPLFVLIEMATHRGGHLYSHLFDEQGWLNEFKAHVKARHSVGDLTEADVEAALTSLSGGDASGFFHRWDATYGTVPFAELRDWIFRDTRMGGPVGDSGFRVTFRFLTADGLPVGNTDFLYGHDPASRTIRLGRTDGNGYLASDAVDFRGRTLYVTDASGGYVANVTVGAASGHYDVTGSGEPSLRRGPNVTPGFEVAGGVSSLAAALWGRHSHSHSRPAQGRRIHGRSRPRVGGNDGVSLAFDPVP